MPRAVIAEAFGTCCLLIAIVGSGIMGDRLSGGNPGLALLANALATAFALYVLITILRPLSGAQFNPCVSLFLAVTGEQSWRTAAGYTIAQAIGAVIGVALTHAMFAMPLVEISAHRRAGGAQWLSEGIATFLLLAVIRGGQRAAPTQVPALVAAWIAGAYWFTASTSFANPAVTLARCLTDSFSGIAVTDVPGFLVAQLVGTGLAVIALPRLFPR